MRGHDAFGTQEEDKAFEQGLIGSQADGLEAFVGPLVRAFVIQPRLAHRGDDKSNIQHPTSNGGGAARPPLGIRLVWRRSPGKVTRRLEPH